MDFFRARILIIRGGMNSIAFADMFAFNSLFNRNNGVGRASHLKTHQIVRSFFIVSSAELMFAIRFCSILFDFHYMFPLARYNYRHVCASIRNFGVSMVPK